MTQQEQAEFEHSLEAARSWMRGARERLRVNDNTQGPREALEARLRETEDIRESEHEGRIKMDMVLAAADVLLQNGNEEVKRETHARLKELKADWEETTTYIIHCHSRIEWVWLHWSEYLKVHEEFMLWLGKMRCTLEPQLELQLGLREKLWQLDHHQVLLSDVRSQAALLERLVEEAIDLYSRTEDSSVGSKVLDVLQDAYKQMTDKAEERVALLQKIAEDHQTYEACGQKFLAWLASKTEELSHCIEAEDSVATKLQALQDLWEGVTREEETLRHIETRAEAVKAQTSPAGAEVITQEVERLREAWEKLGQRLLLEREKLQDVQRLNADYEARTAQLQTDVAQLRRLLQAQSRELEVLGGEITEEQMVAMWMKYKKAHSVLAAEEPAVERTKAQLRELFHFSQGRGPLSNDVLAVVKEYQGVKNRAFQLSTGAEKDLQNVLQDPLRGYKQWTVVATQVLEASAEVSEFSRLALLVQKMEMLLEHSLQLQERLSLLQVKGDLLDSVFGADKAGNILTELSAAMKEREQLHSQLAQRKRHLQDLLLRSTDFGDSYDSISEQLDQIKERLNTADGLQPDILAKKTQSDRLVIIKKDLEDCKAHVTALETLVSSSLTNRHKFDQLYAEWRELHRIVRVKVTESERSVAEHENFHESLLTLEKWLMIMRQKLESFRSTDGEWSVENRRTEAERALGEFPEKELQLHSTEAQGQVVLARTSEEGKLHILRDLHDLRESWMSLHALSLNVFRLLNADGEAEVRENSPLGKAVDQIGSDRGSLLTDDGNKGNEVKLASGDYSGGKEMGLGFREEGFDVRRGFEQDVITRVKETTEGQGLIDVAGGGVDIESIGKPLGNSGGGVERFGQKGEPLQGLGIRGGEFDEMNYMRSLGTSGKGLNLVEGVRVVGEEMPRATTRAGACTGSGGEAGGNFRFGVAFGAKSRSGSGSGSKAEERGVGPSVWASEDRKQGGASDYESWWESGVDMVELPGRNGEDASGKYAEGSLAWRKWQNSGGGIYLGEKALKMRSSGETGMEDTPSGTIFSGRRLNFEDGSIPERLKGSTDTRIQSDAELREFEVWLKAENNKLSKILSQKGQLNAKELRDREQALKDLHSNVGWGQRQLQVLLALYGVGAVPAKAEELEDLRYRWMLYKSKLKEAGDLKAPLQPTDTGMLKEQPVMIGTKRSKFLSRVCCAALPLQLLLASLLLLAFLLPLTDEGASCSLANNFARSFSVMLRYHGPPPT